MIVTVPGALRATAGRGLLCLQSRPAYRAAGRRLVRGVRVVEASQSELARVQSRLNPEENRPPTPPGPGVTPLVAVLNGHLLGFVELVRHPPSHAPYIGHWLFGLHLLHPAYRGLGIGESLVRAALELAGREGAGEVFLVVNETNFPAIGLYGKLGFRQRPLPGLEEILEDEARVNGRRRISMVKDLHAR